MYSLIFSTTRYRETNKLGYMYEDGRNFKLQTFQTATTGKGMFKDDPFWVTKPKLLGLI